MSMFVQLAGSVGGPTYAEEDGAMFLHLYSTDQPTSCDVTLTAVNSSVVATVECGTDGSVCSRQLIAADVLSTDFFVNVAVQYNVAIDSGSLWIDGLLADSYDNATDGDCGAERFWINEMRIGRTSDAYVFNGAYDQIVLDDSPDLSLDRQFFDELLMNATYQCTGRAILLHPLETDIAGRGPNPNYPYRNGALELGLSNPQDATPCGDGSLYFAGGNLAVNNPSFVGDAWSVAFWMSTATAGPSGSTFSTGATIMSTQTGDDGQPWGISIVSNVLVAGSANMTASTNLYSGPIVDGMWHHVVYARKEDGEYLYVDGVLVDSDTTTRVVKDQSGQTYMSIGTNPHVQNLPFVGYVNQLQMSNGFVTPAMVEVMHRSCLADRLVEFDFAPYESGVEDRCVVEGYAELSHVPTSILRKVAKEDPLPRPLDRALLVQDQVGLYDMSSGSSFDVSDAFRYTFDRPSVEGVVYYAALDDNWVLVSLPDYAAVTARMFRPDTVTGTTCDGVPTQTLGSIRAGGPNTTNIPVGDDILVTVVISDSYINFVQGAGYQCTPYDPAPKDGFMELSILTDGVNGTERNSIFTYYNFLSASSDYIGIGDQSGEGTLPLSSYTTTRFSTLLDTGCQRERAEPEEAQLIGHWVFDSSNDFPLQDRVGYWDDVLLIGSAFVDEEGLHVSATEGEYYYYGGGGNEDDGGGGGEEGGYAFEAATPAPPTAPWGNPSYGYPFEDYDNAVVARGMPSLPGPPFEVYNGYPGLMFRLAPGDCDAYVLDTCHPSTLIDTVLEVVTTDTGNLTSWANWASVTSNDDAEDPACADNSVASKVSFPTVEGQSYIVGVAGYSTKHFGQYVLLGYCDGQKKRTLVASMRAGGKHIVGPGISMHRDVDGAPQLVPLSPMAKEEAVQALGESLMATLNDVPSVGPSPRRAGHNGRRHRAGRRRAAGGKRQLPCFEEECGPEGQGPYGEGPGGPGYYEEGPRGYYPLEVDFGVAGNYAGPTFRERTIVAWLRKLDVYEPDAGSPFALADVDTNSWDSPIIGTYADESYPTDSTGSTNEYAWAVASSDSHRVQSIMIEPDEAGGSFVTKVAVSYREHRGRSRVTLYVNDVTLGAFVASSGVYDYGTSNGTLAAFGPRGLTAEFDEDGVPNLKAVGGTNAIIEEVRMYNRALVPDEVKLLQRTGSDLPVASPGTIDKDNVAYLGDWSPCAHEAIENSDVFDRLSTYTSSEEMYSALGGMSIAVQATKVSPNVNTGVDGTTYPLDTVYDTDGSNPLEVPAALQNSGFFSRVGWIVEVDDEWLIAYSVVDRDDMGYNSANDMGWLPYAYNDPTSNFRYRQCEESTWNSGQTVVMSGKGTQSPHPSIPTNAFLYNSSSTLRVLGGLKTLTDPTNLGSCGGVEDGGFTVVAWNIVYNETEYDLFPLFSYQNYANEKDDTIGIGPNTLFVNESYPHPEGSDPYWVLADENGGTLADRGVNANIYWIGECSMGHRPLPFGYVDDVGNGGGGYYNYDDDDGGCEEVLAAAAELECAVFPPVPEFMYEQVGAAADGYGVVYHWRSNEANINWGAGGTNISYEADYSRAGPWASGDEGQCLIESPPFWSRQATYIRYGDGNGNDVWAWASTEHWGVEIIPAIPTGEFYPSCISVPLMSNLEVVTNSPTGVNVSRDEGHVAAWKYLQGDYAADPTSVTTVTCSWNNEGKGVRLSQCGEQFANGPAGVFDYEDGCTGEESDLFGAFQLHDLTQSYADQSDHVVFSFTGFASAAPDSFGIGRNADAEANPDYRGVNNGASLAFKEVYILVDGCVNGDGPAPAPTAPPLPTTYPRCDVEDGTTVYKTVVSSSNDTKGALTDGNLGTTWETANSVSECGPTGLGKVEFYLDRAINPGAVRIANHPDVNKRARIVDVYYGNDLVRKRPDAKVATIVLALDNDDDAGARTYTLPADATGVDKVSLVFRAAGEDGASAVAGLAELVLCPLGPQTLEPPTFVDMAEVADLTLPTRPCTAPTPRPTAQPTPFPTAAPKVTVAVPKNESFSSTNLEEALGGSVQFSSGANGAPADGADGNQIGGNKTLGIRTQRITVELDPDDASQAAGLALALEQIVQKGTGLAALSPRAVCERVGSVWSADDETCVDPDTGRLDRTAEAVSSSLDDIVQCESDFSGAVIPTRVILSNVPQGSTLTIVFEGPKCGVSLDNQDETKRDFLSSARKRQAAALASADAAVAVRVPSSSLQDNGDGTFTFDCSDGGECALAHSLTIGVEGVPTDALEGQTVAVVGFEVTDASPLLDAMIESTVTEYSDDDADLTDLEALVRSSTLLALEADGISPDFALTPPAGRANDICAVRPVPVACNLPVAVSDARSVNAMCMLANVDDEAFAPGSMPLHTCLMDAMSTDGAGCYAALRSLMCTDWCKPCASGPNGTRVEPPKLCPSQCLSVLDACPQLARTCPLEQALLSVCTAPEDNCASPISYVGTHLPPGLGRPGLMSVRAGESRQVDQFAPGRRDTLAVNRALNDGVALVVRGNATLDGRLRLKLTEAPPAGETVTLEVLRLHPAYDGVLSGDFSQVTLRQASQTADVKTQLVSAGIVDTAYVAVVRGVRTTLRPKLPPAGEPVAVSASSLTDGAAADGKVKLVLPPGLESDVVIDGKADFSALNTFEVSPGAVIVASGASNAEKQQAVKDAKPVSIRCADGCNLGSNTKIDVKVPSVFFNLDQESLTDLASTKLPAAKTKPLVVAMPATTDDGGAAAGEGEGEGEGASPVPTPAPTAMPTPVPAADDNVTDVDDYFPIDGPGAVDFRKYTDGEPTPLTMSMSAPEEGVVLVAFAAGEGEDSGIEGAFSKAVAPLSITEPSLAGVEGAGLCDRYRMSQRLESSDGDAVDRLALVFTRKGTALTECFDLPEYCECIFGGDPAGALSSAVDYGVHEGSLTGIMMIMYVLLGLFCCCTGYILYVNARKPDRAATLSPLLVEIAEDEEYGNSPKVAMYNLRLAAAASMDGDDDDVPLDNLEQGKAEQGGGEEKAEPASSAGAASAKSAVASLAASDAGMESSGSKKKKKSVASSAGMEGSPSKLKKKSSSRRQKEVPLYGEVKTLDSTEEGSPTAEAPLYDEVKTLDLEKNASSTPTTAELAKPSAEESTKE